MVEPDVAGPIAVVAVITVCEGFEPRSGRVIFYTGYPHDGRADKDSYPHDGCADKDSYPHDGRADKDSYPHDRHNQYTMLSL